MAFAVAVDDTEEFKQYLTSLIVTAASVAWLFLLFIRSFDLRLTKYRKLFNVIMGLQLLFAMVRNPLLLSSVRSPLVYQEQLNTRFLHRYLLGGLSPFILLSFLRQLMFSCPHLFIFSSFLPLVSSISTLNHRRNRRAVQEDEN